MLLKRLSLKLKSLSKEILAEISKTDSITQEVYNSYTKFSSGVTPWTNISDKAYLDTR